MNQTTDASSASPFTGRAVGLMIAIGVFAFCAVMTLVAFSGDLRPRNQAGSHPFSTAATGYGGMVDLLERAGHTVRISRIKSTLESRDQGLMVATLQPYGMEDIEPDKLLGVTLVVLPKWSGYADFSKPVWQFDTDLLDEDQVARPLKAFASDGEVWRIRAPASIKTPFGKHDPELATDLQVIRSDTLEPVIETAAGAILAKMPYDDIYILSDPDFMNTFGLAELDNARFAVALIDWLKLYEDETVIFDATLHGYIRTENILQAALSPPFLGATLAALAAIGLLGWAASIRFGAPEREDRVFALGKQALADNTAGLILMARRETRLAPGYLALTRRATARDVGAPKTLAEDDLSALFDRMGADDKTSKRPRWSALADALSSPAASTGDLVKKAQAIWSWRKETTHGRD